MKCVLLYISLWSLPPRAQSLTRPCPCATCNWLLHPAPTNAQDGLDPPQLALVVFILPSMNATTSLALVGQHLQLALVFFLYCLVHLLMCTHDLPCYHHPLQLALAVVFPLPTRHLLMCTLAMSTFCNLHCVVVVVVCDGDFM